MKIDDYSHWARARQGDVEDALQRWVSEDSPAGLGEVMRYAVLDGGKRLRPLLVMAAAEAVSGDPASALRAAVAVELIHAYSLVHDDMPCMDNDVLRRGKPTVHVKYGEAQAMLAGDAMQALAFEVLTPDAGMSPDLMARLVRLLARASGHAGMAGGQAIDLASVGCQLDEASLRDMHRRKTGVLLQASVMMGAACGPADAPASFEDAQAELDELVRAMETGQMPLDGLLSAYKRGAQLLEFCRSRLDAVEEQVKVLEEGQLKPWTRP